MQRYLNSTLYLKKATIFPEGEITLEDILHKISTDVPDFMDRKYDKDFLSAYFITSIKKDSTRNAGAFVRFALNDTGSTGVMTTKRSHIEGDVEEHRAPKNKAFVQKEIFLYVSGNHLIACGIGNRDKVISEIVTHVAANAGVLDQAARVFISDVPNTPQLKKINDVGVKKIDFDLSSYLADLDELPFEKRSKGIEAVLLSMFSKVPTSRDISYRSATRGKVTLSRGKFSKDEYSIKDEWLTNVGETVVNADIEDYTIVLEDGSKISTKTIKVSKSVRIKKYANTYDRAHADLMMAEYYDELSRIGSLTW